MCSRYSAFARLARSCVLWTSSSVVLEKIRTRQCRETKSQNMCRVRDKAGRLECVYPRSDRTVSMGDRMLNIAPGNQHRLTSLVSSERRLS